MMDAVITLVGGFILGYLLGGEMMKRKILTMLEHMKKEYMNGL